MSRKYNKYYVYGEIVFVRYSNCNEYFICDLDDWNKLKDYCWMKDSKGYAATNIVVDNKKTPKRFHSFVFGATNSLVVDHIYPISYGLCDNRKCNLRIVTQQENVWNAKLHKRNISGCKGVTWDKTRNMWRVTFCRNGVKKQIGRFKNLEDAINARIKAEQKFNLQRS